VTVTVHNVERLLSDDLLEDVLSKLSLELETRARLGGVETMVVSKLSGDDLEHFYRVRLVFIDGEDVSAGDHHVPEWVFGKMARRLGLSYLHESATGSIWYSKVGKVQEAWR
jgi:hypothetical protein